MQIFMFLSGSRKFFVIGETQEQARQDFEIYLKDHKIGESRTIQDFSMSILGRVGENIFIS